MWWLQHECFHIVNVVMAKYYAMALVAVLTFMTSIINSDCCNGPSDKMTLMAIMAVMTILCVMTLMAVMIIMAVIAFLTRWTCL